LVEELASKLEDRAGAINQALEDRLAGGVTQGRPRVDLELT
jgi:hypothetical protein